MLNVMIPMAHAHGKCLAQIRPHHFSNTVYAGWLNNFMIPGAHAQDKGLARISPIFFPIWQERVPFLEH